MKTTVRHDITVRTIPTDNDCELVVTTVTTDTATVEQTEVVKAKSRHSLVAHMGWTVTLADGRKGTVSDAFTLTTLTGKTGRRVKITPALEEEFTQAIFDARLARPVCSAR